MATLLDPNLDRPLPALLAAFAGWKTLLLAVALATPGPGYDSSTGILLGGARDEAAAPLARLAERLVRWDAVYFADIARRGRVWEQEWAFGWGWTRLLQLVAQCTPPRLIHLDTEVLIVV